MKPHLTNRESWLVVFLIVIMLMFVAGCARQENQSHIIPQHQSGMGAERAALGPIMITDCHGGPAVVYADKELTIPMANPIIPDSHGEVAFWTSKTVCTAQEKTK